tara:strand:- start:21600 stop:23264 length:1665 start_codon:yes stop_codon:yes gene_type:complete
MKKKKKLIITNLKKDVFDGEIDAVSHVLYNFNQGTINRSEISCLNDARKLHTIALDEKKSYLDFIYSQNQIFLENDLVFNNNLSLYFLSIFSNKRSEFFSTYSDYLHQLILKEILNKNTFEKIYTIGFSNEELVQLRKNLKIKISSYDYLKPSSKQYIRSGKFNLFFFYSFLYLVVIKLIFRKTNRQVNQFFYAQYPKHFTQDFNHKKYGTLVSSNDSFLLSIISDGFHQSLKPLAFFSTLSRLRKTPSERYILLDRYLNWKDFFSAFSNLFHYKKKFKPLLNKSYVVNGIDLSFQIKKELKLSLHQIPRLLMYLNAYKTAFDTHNPSQVVYYLHEFVSGRFISYVLNTYFPNVKSTGFQHGPIAKRKLLYALSPSESKGKNYLFNVPLPKINICEDQASKNIYASYGYRNLLISPKINRLNYLEFIKRDKVEENTCLLAGGLHDSDQIIQYALNTNIYQNKKVWVKLHPMVNTVKYKKRIRAVNHPNLQLANESLLFHLNKVEEVIFTYSSVGGEALKLNIKTSLLAFGHRVNESPLLDDNLSNPLLTIAYID